MTQQQQQQLMLSSQLLQQQLQVFGLRTRTVVAEGWKALED
jgi:hypothetical protein